VPVTPVHSLVAIARNGWSRSIGTPGPNQSESVVAISRYAHVRRRLQIFSKGVEEKRELDSLGHYVWLTEFIERLTDVIRKMGREK
jgi:hypothetical protein